MLIRCLYASRAAMPPAPSQVDSILAQSRRNNPAHGVTGILCFTDTLFIQVLEGGRGAVSALLARIMGDPRHEGVQLLAYEEIAERRFGSWSMGQVNIARVNTALLLKYSERPELDPFAISGQATMSLLCELVATASIVSKSG